MPAVEESYSLLKKDIVRQLENEMFFMEAVKYNYNLFAARRGLLVQMSNRRLREAFRYWQDDVSRTTLRIRPAEKGNDSKSAATKDVELDHFKHASFIAFWLRRMNPINSTKVVAVQDDYPTEIGIKRKHQFLEYGNEFCALQIGYQICLNYEVAKKYASSTEILKPFGRRADYLRQTVQFPEKLIADFTMILKHKSLSPYALLLMYKSLFSSSQ